MIGPTPLLDFFKRGEVERDVRMEAALGTLAPRAYEQLAILVLLLEDPDQEIRRTADETLSRIPEEALKAFLARSDVPIGLREFFGDRGVFPDEMHDIQVEVDVEEPLLETPGGEAKHFGIGLGQADVGGDDDVVEEVRDTTRAEALGPSAICVREQTELDAPGRAQTKSPPLRR